MVKNIGLALISVASLLLAGEAFLRVGGYKIVTFYPLGGFHQFDPELGWSQRPDHEAFFLSREFKVKVKSNSYGFRDTEFQLSKAEGINRVVVLGDSYTWGWGVEREEIFCEVAEKEMEKAEFYNLGVNAYGTDQEYLLFKKLGRKFSPDLTVLAFYHNDISDNHRKDSQKPVFSLIDGKLFLTAKPKPFSAGRKLKMFLKKNFLLYYFIDYKFAQLKQLRDSPQSNYGLADHFFKEYSKETQEGWNLTKSLLIKIKELSNNPLLVVYIPTRLQVDDKTFQKALTSLKIDGNKIDMLSPNKILSKFSESNEIHFLDLTPHFKKEYNKVPLYFEYDDHLTPAGHKLASIILKEKAQELLKSF